jgi:ADP-ribose pyrophosphatase YjhB (NUDIX family)
MNQSGDANILGQYIEVGYEGHRDFIPENIYATMLDNVVIACVDILLIYENKIFIAKRVQYPHADWWLLGGRMRTGEKVNDSARRIVLIESNLAIDEDRFSFLTLYAAAWNLRAHEPERNGTHTISIVLSATLTQDEYGKIVLNKEYSEGRLMSASDILNTESLHPALKQCASILL